MNGTITHTYDGHTNAPKSEIKLANMNEIFIMMQFTNNYPEMQPPIKKNHICKLFFFFLVEGVVTFDYLCRGEVSML